jgi:hypothetical protein
MGILLVVSGLGGTDGITAVGILVTEAPPLIFFGRFFDFDIFSALQLEIAKYCADFNAAPQQINVSN